jgi:MFS superfamily sulfate permease-like transporter
VLLLYHISRLEVHLRYGGNQTIWLYLEGAATFLQLPMLTALFNRISRRAKLEVDTKKLVYIDQAYSTYLESLRQEFEGNGGSLKILSAPSP